MVYLIQYDGDVPVQTPLPYVMHYADGDNLWTETFSYDYSVGSFAFYVTYSDFFTENSPGECQFKVVMHWYFVFLSMYSVQSFREQYLKIVGSMHTDSENNAYRL